MSSETLVVPLVDQLDAFFGQYTAAGQSPGLVYGLVGTDGLEHTRGSGPPTTTAPPLTPTRSSRSPR